jgi:hypothetical protein
VHALKKVITKSVDRDMIWDGSTALAVAIANGSVVGAQLLLEEGANPNTLLADHRSGLQLLLSKENETKFEGGARKELGALMLSCGANPLQKVNIATAGKDTVLGLVMDQAYAEYEPREVSKQATKALHTGAISVFSGEEEWPIMDMLVENMREVNRKHIMKHGKPMEKFCEECGRSHGVPFHTCNRCGMVVFCRDKCKMRAFSTHHRHVCVTYRKLKGETQWGDDGDATQWRPRKLPEGKEFELEHWERSCARALATPLEENPELAYTSTVRATPIRTTSRYGARFSGRNLHSRMRLIPTPLFRLKRCHACDQYHSSRVSTASYRLAL